MDVNTGEALMRISNIKLIIVVFLNFFVSCTGGDGQGMEVNPWPVHRYDHKNTGRCNFEGTDKLNVIIRKRLQHNQDLLIWPTSSLVSDGRGNIFFMGRTNDFLGLYAVNSSGEVKWYIPNDSSIPINHLSSAVPAIDQSGNIYAVNLYPEGDQEAKGLSCVNSDGEILWVNKEETVYSNGGLNFSNDYSVVYVPDTPPPGPLTAFDTATGEFLWKSNARWTTYTTPAIDDDGTIYYGDTYANLYAINTNGTKKWEINLADYAEDIVSAPAIGEDGTVYVICEYGQLNGPLIAVSRSGKVKWIHEFKEFRIFSSAPAIDPDGRIIVGHAGTVYSFNPDGTIYWSIDLGEGSYSNYRVIIDNRGRVYVYLGRTIWILKGESGEILDQYSLPYE